MAEPISKPEFLADLQARIDRHRRLVTGTFQTLDDATLAWQSDPKEWNITYLRRQDALCAILDQVGPVDLSRTSVPLEKGIRFNLGDCLKILVYHDGLHIDQARRVLEAYQPI
jgi:hypothetical protein